MKKSSMILMSLLLFCFTMVYVGVDGNGVDSVVDLFYGGGDLVIGGLLTAGRSTNCSTNCSGGVNRFWLANVEDIDTITEDATGVTAITMIASKVFYEMEFAEETGQFLENVTLTNCAVVVVQTLATTWRCRDMGDVDAIMEIANNCCGMVCIHEEATDTTWIWGHQLKQRVRLQTAVGDSGITFDSENKEVITIAARAKQKAVEFVPAAAGVPVT